MLFNSLEFAVFFVIVYSLYLVLDHRWQNRMLLLASYVFYGAWDWRFLSLIWISTLLDYVCGIKIHETEEPRRRKGWLWLSVCGNLAILGFFKYFDFFAASLQGLLGQFGITPQPRFLHLILPVGISFYTFQTMSYTIDIYRRQFAPTRHLPDLALFVAFFPQLVAGPIERARRLLPQIQAPRKVTLAQLYEGCYLIFWGLFEKIFVADNLARLGDAVFSSSPPYNGVIVLFAAYAVAFQIYYDFAGYSNIARGLARCMGFTIMVNFRLPYFSTSPREVWTRWHISLSSWLRDYLYSPLGGNRGGPLRTCRNVLLTMLLGGLWHGASWTFIMWGAYHALLLMLYQLLARVRRRLPALRKGVLPARLSFTLRVLVFFHLWCLGAIFFRAESLAQVGAMVYGLLWSFHVVPGIGLQAMAVQLIFFLGVVLLVEGLQYWTKDLLVMLKIHPVMRAVFYSVGVMLLIVYGAYGERDFVYFQF